MPLTFVVKNHVSETQQCLQHDTPCPRCLWPFSSSDLTFSFIPPGNETIEQKVHAKGSCETFPCAVGSWRCAGCTALLVKTYVEVVDGLHEQSTKDAAEKEVLPLLNQNCVEGDRHTWRVEVRKVSMLLPCIQMAGTSHHI